MADLSIIIVNYRGWERLSQCLDSLNKITDNRFSFEVLVVDNNSSDGILDQFSQLYPQIGFKSNTGNLGFANGCNLGEKNTRSPFLLFLNPDTVVSAGAIFGLLQEARIRRPCSIISCRQIRENGIEEKPYGRFLSPTTLTGWQRALTRIVFRQRQTPFLQTSEYIYPDWISGSVVMIGRESFQRLGGWNEDFWMYFEDVDLCRRAAMKNGEIVFLRNACIEHNHGGASRINRKVTALTKTEVHISRHVYISKHEKGLRGCYMHSFLIVNNLILGLLPAVLSIPFFFVKKLSVVSQTYFQMIKYYLNVLRSGTWLSKRSVNYHSKK